MRSTCTRHSFKLFIYCPLDWLVHLWCCSLTSYSQKSTNSVDCCNLFYFKKKCGSNTGSWFQAMLRYRAEKESSEDLTFLFVERRKICLSRFVSTCFLSVTGFFLFRRARLNNKLNAKYMIKYTDLNKIFVWGCLNSLQDKLRSSQIFEVFKWCHH